MQNKKNTSRQNNSSSRSRNNDKSPTFGYYNETSDEKECRIATVPAMTPMTVDNVKDALAQE